VEKKETSQREKYPERVQKERRDIKYSTPIS
jgi:hypothetical protein